MSLIEAACSALLCAHSEFFNGITRSLELFVIGVGVEALVDAFARPIDKSSQLLNVRTMLPLLLILNMRFSGLVELFKFGLKLPNWLLLLLKEGGEADVPSTDVGIINGMDRTLRLLE